MLFCITETLGNERVELQELLDNARRNEALLKRLQSFELSLLACQSWYELIHTLLEVLPRQFKLDALSFKLYDPDARIQSSIRRSLDIEHAYLLERIDFLKQPPEPVLGIVKPPAPWVSGLALPLVRSNACLGLLCLYSSREHRFNPDLATDFMQHLAAIIAACLVLVQHNEEQTYLALTDPLTLAENRRGFERAFKREWARGVRHTHPFALFMLDLDFFKQVNDKHGHATGDRLLQTFCQQMRRELRPNDHIGRLGGEEFGLLLTEFQPQQIKAVAQRLQQAVRELQVLNDQGESVSITASASYMVVQPKANMEVTLEHLLQHLDGFLYQAKRLGRDCFLNAIETTPA